MKVTVKDFKVQLTAQGHLGATKHSYKWINYQTSLMLKATPKSTSSNTTDVYLEWKRCQLHIGLSTQIVRKALTRTFWVFWSFFCWTATVISVLNCPSFTLVIYLLLFLLLDKRHRRHCYHQHRHNFPPPHPFFFFFFCCPKIILCGWEDVKIHLLSN